MTTYYKLEEISKNNGKNGNQTWIIISNNVYNVTEYLDEHPGGSELITEWAGKDCTKAFNDAGHSSDAKSQLKEFKIGELHMSANEEVDKTVEDDVDTNVEDVNDDRGGKQSAKTTSAKVNSNSSTPKPQTRSCISIITCGLCG